MLLQLPLNLFVLSLEFDHDRVQTLESCYHGQKGGGELLLRWLGLEVLFDSHNAWQSALINYGGTMQRAVPDSVMWDSPKAVIFKLSLAYLDKENVDSFQ